jgi:tRNA(adenine34) deaminase
MKNMDIHFMKEALKKAKEAYLLKEVPIGAVLVYKNKIIARGHNMVNLLKDSTAHAEMLCLSKGFSYFNDWRLLNTELYTTIEPCAMCAGAILLSRVKRLIWGASDIRVGANGSFVDIFKNHPIHSVEIRSGVLEGEAKSLIQKFFRERRN